MYVYRLQNIEGSLLYLTDANATITIDTSLLNYKQLRILPPSSIYTTVPIYVFIGGILEYIDDDTVVYHHHPQSHPSSTISSNKGEEVDVSMGNINYMDHENDNNTPPIILTKNETPEEEASYTTAVSSAVPVVGGIPTVNHKIPLLCIKAYVFRLVDLGINPNVSTSITSIIPSSSSSLSSTNHNNNSSISSSESKIISRDNNTRTIPGSTVYPELHQLLMNRRQFLKEMIAKME